MITCDLEAPRHAIGGEPIRLTCRVHGALPRSEIAVEIWRTRPGASARLATVRFLAASSGGGQGSAQVALAGGAGDPVPVTLVAHPSADGRAGAPDTEIVMVR